MENSTTSDNQSRNSSYDVAMESLSNSISDVSNSAINKTQDAVKTSVEFAKKYPIHTAVGAGVAGFLAGVISSKISK